jgi:predicted nucleic acid-binding protein
VDALELLGGEAPFIADTSAWWRFSSLSDELAGLIKTAVANERLWTTPIVRMEILYSARSTSEYIALETELDALRILRNDRAVANAAIERDRRAGRAQRWVSPRAAHRCAIASAAAEHGGIAVLHHDAHFDKLAEVLTFENVELPGS